MGKPLSKLGWIPSDNPVKISEPSNELKTAGFAVYDKPTHQMFNWFLNLTDQWIDYFDESLSEGTANQILGMKSDATGTEFKTFAATGPITITHATGLVTIAMPAATGDAAGYVTTGTQDFGGNKYFLDDVSIDGNLTVSGTLIYLNVENLQVEDKNIEINYGGSTAAASGAGLNVLGTANALIASIQWDSTLTRSKWKAGPAGSEGELLRAGDIVDADIASGANIGGSKIAAASVSVPGIVTTGNQSFAGRKSGNGFLPAGMIMPFAGATPPTGWLACDGSEVSQTTYADLFAAISTTWNAAKNPLTGGTYGAPTAGNFRLPDLRGAFLRGTGTFSDGIGTDTTLAGYQGDQMQGHKQGLDSAGGAASSFYTTTGSNTGYYANTYYTNLTPTNGPVSDGINGTPRTGKETRPRNVGVNYLIKT